MRIEANIDALVGPTHHFGGLGIGNVASRRNAGQISNPRQAALEGLHKAALVASFGVPQFLWLPPMRPNLDLLFNLGFSDVNDTPDSLRKMLAQARHQAPLALSAAFSSAYMWAANAATFSPATDTADERDHFTPANLVSSWHRSSESRERASDINLLWGKGQSYVVHDPLSCILPLRDEGAANHVRLCDRTGEVGFNIFVFGEGDEQKSQTMLFPRQTRAASEAVARRHCLPAEHVFFLQQHPEAVSAGVFHNDVIATSHQHLLIHHEKAFVDADVEIDRLEAAFFERAGYPLKRVVVRNTELSLNDAVSSYFFNCQIVTPRSADDRDTANMVLICPAQCNRMPAAQKLIRRLLSDPSIPIEEVRYVTLEQSMGGGGGPACLRLRISLKDDMLAAKHPNLRLTTQVVDLVAAHVTEHYPTHVSFDELANADFVDQVQHTTRELHRIVLHTAMESR